MPSMEEIFRPFAGSPPSAGRTAAYAKQANTVEARLEWGNGGGFGEERPGATSGTGVENTEVEEVPPRSQIVHIDLAVVGNGASGPLPFWWTGGISFRVPGIEDSEIAASVLAAGEADGLRPQSEGIEDMFFDLQYSQTDRSLPILP